MADADAQFYGTGPQSETDRQSHPINAWGACPSSGMWPQAVPNPQAEDTSGLGSYVPINLPPVNGPRAADVVGPWSLVGDNSQGGGSMYG
jgi:hypothetical protein